MKNHHGAGAPKGQRGFSMVEMLMAAFILAIGILGLAMLQTMTLRSNTGTRSQTTAVTVADRVLDEAEALGRNSLLWAHSKATPPTLSPNYFGSTVLTQYFKYDGTSATAADYFTVTITPTDDTAAVAGIGGIKVLTVQVAWNEGIGAASTMVSRKIIISRKITYATTSA